MNNQLIITIIILFLVSLLFLVAYLNSKRIPQRKKELIYNKLNDVKNQLSTNDIYANRDAVVKLDNLLAKALNIKYGNDNSCGENLKYAKNFFNKDLYQNLWDVHKLRNSIVHGDIEVDFDEASKAYSIYKIGITKLLK